MLSVKGVKISDIRLLNPPPSSWRSDPEFRIKIKYGSETRSTGKGAAKKGDVDGDCVVWNQPITFTGDIADDSILTFTAVRAHGLISKIIGSTGQRVGDLLKIQSDSGSCKLDFAGKCHLTFRIERLSDVVPGVVDEASGALTGLPNLKVAAEASNVTTSAVQFYDDQEGTWSLFLLQFQAFMKVMDDVSEISPYVKIAWSILSVIPKTIITQKNRDDKVKQLCGKLKDIYDYVTDAKRLPDLTTTQSKTLSVLVQQTIECAYFIREYSTEHTVKNMVKGASMDDKIQGFNDKFDHLKQVMTDSVSLETSIVTLRVSEKISEQNDLTLLEGMPYDSEAGFNHGKRCDPGTRQTLISEILEWVNGNTSPQILLLSGQAGTGKSSVAHTIAGLFRSQNRLGSMFCFNRSYKDRRNYLFSNISRDLADSDGMWQNELVKAVKKTADRKSKDPQIQFEELIVKPSQNVSTIGSVVIVVDALDESGDREERRKILELLFDRCSELPKNYRIIVTSRPEQDIELRWQNSKVLCRRMGDINVEETHSDIQAYISVFLAPISSTLDKIDRNWCKILTKRAEGLFQWARTACEFIDPTVIHPQLVEKRWKTVSDSSPSLYGLYHQIISGQSESRDADFIDDFRMIVGAIIMAQEPLSIDALQYIFPSVRDVKTILSPFGSLFVGVHDSFTPIRPLHTSLFDFFTATENKYWIDTSDQSVMAIACLKLMNQMLCFNICKLETSHLRNWDVPNIDTRVKEAIPLHLSYSCRFWAFHLQSSRSRNDLLCEIRMLMDYNLLYLFEVLSLLGTVDQVYVAMQGLVDWCIDVDSGLAADASDALDFGYEFGDVMMESTPHLYLSALPFTPRDSFISRTYLAAYPGLFTFDIDQLSCKIGITRKHTHSYSTSVAFHPKGKYIATGSFDGEVWIWDHTTGELARKYNHTSGSSICDIVFSSDGELVYCCFKNGDIMVWNIRTGETQEESYTGVTGDWSVLCTISSNGCFMAFQTGNWSSSQFLLYDRTNRLTLKQIQSTNDIGRIAFSPNGNFLAFLMDYEVHVWNTRQARDTLLHDQTSSVFAIALSDNCVALGCHDTIEIWDVPTSQKVTEIRHGTRVELLQFTPDNQYIISSYCETYSIWNVSTGDFIGQSSMDDDIMCLAFSPDSKFIALGAKDGTINVRQWDTSTHPRSHCALDDGYPMEIWLRNKYLIIWYKVGLGVKSYLQISDVTTMDTIIFEAELNYRWSPITVSPDKGHVHVAYVTGRGLSLWDETKGEVIVDESGHRIAALASSSKYLVSADINEGDRGGTIRTWDVYTGELIGEPYAIAKQVEKLVIPEGSTCFIVAYHRQIELREHGSGRIIGGPFESEPISDSSVVALSPNQTHIISIHTEGAEIIDVSTGARVNWVSYVNNSMVRLSPDGKYLAWAADDGAMKLFDTDTAMPLETPFLGLRVHGLGFSNDSKQIVIASSNADGSEMTATPHLDVWDIPSGQMSIKSLLFENKFRSEIRNLSLSNGYLLFNSDLAVVWDMDAYAKMASTLHDTHWNDTQLVDSPEEKWLIENTSRSKKTEVLDYAVMAWKKASLPTLARPTDDGWVWGLGGELLLWVPEQRRAGFWSPCTTHLPYQNATKLNFNNFVHGTRWTECRKNTNS